MNAQELAEKYGEKIFMLQSIARTAVRDVDPQVVMTGVYHSNLLSTLLLMFTCLIQNDLMYFRIDTKRFEILVAPFWGEVKYGVTGAIKEKGYTLFVLQRKPGQT
jgi:hypothetical protein